MKHETPGSSAVESPSSRFGSRFPCVHTVRTDFPELYRYKLKKKTQTYLEKAPRTCYTGLLWLVL